MKKIIFIFLVVFITEVRSTETIYNTDLITINSLEYDKTRLIVFKPCILNKYIITNDKKNSELDNLIDNIGQEYIDNNVYILVDRRKDWFKIPFFKSCEAPENYKDFLIEFSRLISIVEVLKLNQNTGM